eukprot:Rmarinus@m.8854
MPPIQSGGGLPSPVRPRRHSRPDARASPKEWADYRMLEFEARTIDAERRTKVFEEQSQKLQEELEREREKRAHAEEQMMSLHQRVFEVENRARNAEKALKQIESQLRKDENAKSAECVQLKKYLTEAKKKVEELERTCDEMRQNFKEEQETLDALKTFLTKKFQVQFGSVNDGGDVYRGFLLHSQPHFWGRCLFSSGDVYYGAWCEGVPDGAFGICEFANGNRYEGVWSNGGYHGRGVFTYDNGDSFQGVWENDKRHGVGLFITATGNRYHEEWEYDVRKRRRRCVAGCPCAFGEVPSMEDVTEDPAATDKNQPSGSGRYHSRTHSSAAGSPTTPPTSSSSRRPGSTEPRPSPAGHAAGPDTSRDGSSSKRGGSARRRASEPNFGREPHRSAPTPPAHTQPHMPPHPHTQYPPDQPLRIGPCLGLCMPLSEDDGGKAQCKSCTAWRMFEALQRDHAYLLRYPDIPWPDSMPRQSGKRARDFARRWHPDKWIGKGCTPATARQYWRA